MSPPAARALGPEQRHGWMSALRLRPGGSTAQQVSPSSVPLLQSFTPATFASFATTTPQCFLEGSIWDRLSALACRKWQILIAARGDRGVCISSVLSLLLVFSPTGPLASLSVCLEGNSCRALDVGLHWGSEGCSDRNIGFGDASIGKSMESPALNVQFRHFGQPDRSSHQSSFPCFRFMAFQQQHIPLSSFLLPSLRRPCEMSGFCLKPQQFPGGMD